MEKNQENLFRLALHRHGLIPSESESDSDDGYAEFDHTHERNKPPPLDPEFIQKNLIVVYPKVIENVWAKRLEACSKNTDNNAVVENSNVSSISSSTFASSVENNSGISKNEITHETLEFTGHGPSNIEVNEAQIKCVDSKSYLLHDSLIATSIEGQYTISGLENIQNLGSCKPSLAETGNIIQKKKKKKKKTSASEKNNVPVSTKIDVEGIHLESVYLHYSLPELETSKNYNQQRLVNSPKINYETDKIDSDDEKKINNLVPSDINIVEDENNEFTKINERKEKHVCAEKITTEQNLYGKIQEQSNCSKDISFSSHISGSKKKKHKFIPCNLLDEKFSTTIPTNVDSHSQKNSQKKQKSKGVKKNEKLPHNDKGKMKNNVKSHQQLATSTLFNCQTEDEFSKNFPQLNTNSVDENNELVDAIEIKPENCFEEKNTLELAAYKSVDSVHLQEQIDFNAESLSAETETSNKKTKKYKFISCNSLDETFTTIPPVSHTQQNSSKKKKSKKAPSSENTEPGTKKKKYGGLVPCNVLDEKPSSITFETDFSCNQQILSSNKKTLVTPIKSKMTEREIEMREIIKDYIYKILELNPLLLYSIGIDRRHDIPLENINLTGACVTESITFDGKMNKYESTSLYRLEPNTFKTNTVEGMGGSSNESSLTSVVKKKNKKKRKVSRLKKELIEADNNKKVQFGFPGYLDLGSYLENLDNNNLCCSTGLMTFSENIKVPVDRTFQKHEYQEKNTIRVITKFDTGNITNYKCLFSYITYLEKTFSKRERQIRELILSKFGYGSNTFWTNLDYFKNIHYGLEIYPHSENTLEKHNLYEPDIITGMCIEFMCYTSEHGTSYGVENRRSVLVQACCEESAQTNNCSRKDFLNSTKEITNEGEPLAERNRGESLHFTLACDEANGIPVRRRDANIERKADKTVLDTSVHYETSYIDEKYPENESNPLKTKAIQNSSRLVFKTSQVPYPFTIIVHFILVFVFLHLVISFMNWVIYNFLPLMLFFMCIIILDVSN